MSENLLDDLRSIAGKIDPSLLPVANEVGPLLGTVVHYLQFGDKLLQAGEKGASDLSELLTPAPPEPAPVAVSPPAPTSAADAQTIAELRDQLAAATAALATAQQTQLGDHVSNAPPAEPTA